MFGLCSDIPSSEPGLPAEISQPCLWVLQVIIALYVLHGLRVVSLPQPILLRQLLLQPLLPAQLVQWQPLQVSFS